MKLGVDFHEFIFVIVLHSWLCPNYAFSNFGFSRCVEINCFFIPSQNIFPFLLLLLLIILILLMLLITWQKGSQHIYTAYRIISKTSTGVSQWPHNWMSHSAIQVIASGVALGSSCRKPENACRAPSCTICLIVFVSASQSQSVHPQWYRGDITHVLWITYLLSIETHITYTFMGSRSLHHWSTRNRHQIVLYSAPQCKTMLANFLHRTPRLKIVMRLCILCLENVQALKSRLAWIFLFSSAEIGIVMDLL